MFREAIGLFVPEPKAKLYIPKNSGLHEYVNNLLSSPASAMSKTGLKVAEVVRFSDISLIGREIVNPWEEEYRRISAVAQKPTGSSTSKLLADSNAICKKVGEESAEFVRAFTQETGIPEEFNGVVYALMAAAAKLQVPWREIEADLKSRWS